MRSTHIKALAKHFLDQQINEETKLQDVPPGTKDWYYIPPLRDSTEQQCVELRRISDKRGDTIWSIYFGYMPEWNTIVYWIGLDFV